jgi:hypothetical protein
MAILLIILALFGFVFAGFGSGSSSTGSATATAPPPVVRCSSHSGPPVSAPERRRCGPPPANP